MSYIGFKELFHREEEGISLVLSTVSRKAITLQEKFAPLQKVVIVAKVPWARAREEIPLYIATAWNLFKNLKALIDKRKSGVRCGFGVDKLQSGFDEAIACNVGDVFITACIEAFFMHEIVSDLSAKEKFAFEISSILLDSDIVVANAFFANL